MPLLPVTTATGMSKRLRQNVASAASACSGSSTAIRLPDAARRMPAVDQRRRRAVLQRARDEVMAVEALAFQRDEQIAAG